MDEKELKEWLAWRGSEDDRLYEVYGKPLESEHTGTLVAIGPTGDLILGDDQFALTKQAIDRFGSGNFAFRRIGYDYVVRIRALGR